MWTCPRCSNQNLAVRKQCDSCGYKPETATRPPPRPPRPATDSEPAIKTDPAPEPFEPGTPAAGSEGTTVEPQPEPRPDILRHYKKEATRLTPALVIYLIDVSDSMAEPFETKKKIDYVNEALKSTLRRMMQRSTRGDTISPRYRLAMATYSDQVFDFIGGVRTIDEVAKKGAFTLSPRFGTNTHAAFKWALDILQEELPGLNGKPAPMVCHLTDGQYTTGDPEPLAKEMMKLSNDDGFVLVENIYIGPDLTSAPMGVVDSWPGIMQASELRSDYAKKLFRMSSPLPASYAEEINREGYSIRPGCRMLIPGSSSDLVELAFAISGATHVG
jgi:hypothetical protein